MKQTETFSKFAYKLCSYTIRLFSDEALLEAAANDVLNGLIDEAIRGQAFEIHRYVRYVLSRIH